MNQQNKVTMEIKFQLITPARAAEMLKKNIGNRHLRQRHVDTLARDMKNGEWMQTGDPIRLSHGGNILDGQHRLAAQVQSGVTLNHVVIHGVKEEAFAVIDTGMRRNAKDVFHIAGTKYTSMLPSILNRYLALKSGKSKQNAIHLNTTNAMLLDCYDADPEYWSELARQTNAWYDLINKVISPAIIGSHYAFLSDISNEDAFVFFHTLCSADAMSKPVAALRKMLYDNKYSNKKLTTDGISYAIIVAWNHYRAKRDVTRIIVKKGSTIPKAL